MVGDDSTGEAILRGHSNVDTVDNRVTHSMVGDGKARLGHEMTDA